jgi:hypothetical protein
MNHSTGTGVLSDKRMAYTHTPQVRNEGWSEKQKQKLKKTEKHTHNVPQQLPQPTTNLPAQ